MRGTQGIYMARAIRRTDALTKQDFHAALRTWYTASSATTIGDPGTSTSKPWVMITDGDLCYHLDAHTTRRAVEGYLHSVTRYGEEIAWATRREGPGKRTRVVFGPFQLAEHEFQLFAYAT